LLLGKWSQDMRASTAYFAGAGTVLVAIVTGLGGGFLVADIINPKSSKHGTEMTRLEQRMSPQPIAATAAPAQPVLYLGAVQPNAPGTAAAVPAPAEPANSTQTEAASSTSTPAQPSDASTAKPQPAASEAAAAQAVAHERAAAAPDDAIAKARDIDVKRVEKRRIERRQQWAERRRYQQRRQEQELRAVEERVREDTYPTRQAFREEPARIESPQIRLFGQDWESDF
jgi:hypothetical protein